MKSIGKGAVNRARSKSVRVAAMLAFAAALCLGLLGASRQAEAGSHARSPLDGAVANKLYGQLKDAAQAGPTNTRMRAIVHMASQADLSTWPTTDRPMTSSPFVICRLPYLHRGALRRGALHRGATCRQ